MINKSIKYLFSFLLLIAVFSSCKQSEHEQLLSQISEMEKQLFEEKKGVIDKKEAANMIHYYVSVRSKDHVGKVRIKLKKKLSPRQLFQ